MNEEKKVFKLNPTGTAEKYLTQLKSLKTGKFSNSYILTGDILPISCKHTHDDKLTIKPFNGPTMTEDEPLWGYPNVIVKKINYSQESEKYVLDLEVT